MEAQGGKPNGLRHAASVVGRGKSTEQPQKSAER